MSERGLLTTEAIDAYRATLDETRRRLDYLRQEMAGLDAMVTDVLNGASVTLAAERTAATTATDNTQAEWTLSIAGDQARMMAELDTHIMRPWFTVHGKAYYVNTPFYDLNGWLLGMARLVFTGPYPGWRVEVPAHPDKQGPGGDSMVDCTGPRPCRWQTDSRLIKYTPLCPESNDIAVNAKNHQLRKNVRRSYWPKAVPAADCPNEWKPKTAAYSDAPFVDEDGRAHSFAPMPKAQATEAIGLVFRISSVARSTPWLIPAKLYKGEA